MKTFPACLRRWAMALLPLSLLVLTLASSPVAARELCKNLLATGNPEYPPYLWRDPEDENKLIGANADFMQALARELGVSIEVRYMGPWGRVQEEAKLGRLDLLAGAFFTLPRLDYMDYFYPAFRETRTVLWMPSTSSLNFKKWPDLISKQGVTVINNSFGEDFDRYAKESLKINMVPSLEQAIKMLSMYRADYLIYEEDPGLAYVAKMNITGLKTSAVAVASENLYVTMAHKSACNTAEFRGRLSKAIYTLTKQGVMNKFITQNIQLWRKQQAK